MLFGGGGCLCRHRAQFHPDSVASTLYEDTLQVKSDALLASYARLYVIYCRILDQSYADCLHRSAPHKPLRSKPKSARTAAGEQLVTISI